MEELNDNLKSKDTLKTFFQKGDIPEEHQFSDLIDAFRHISDGHTIKEVVTAPNGITSITLSNGTIVAITPPVSDEYVPKTGGTFTGKVGIGTSILAGLLTLNGNDTNLLRLENDTPDKEANMRFRSKSNSGGTLHSDISLYATGENQGYLGFKVPHNNTVNAGYNMVINHKGEVGIGTPTPGALLEVKGTFSPTRPHLAVNSVDEHVSIDLQHQGVSKGSMWYNAGIDTMAFGKGISARHTLFINSNDNFGMGTNNPAQKLHVNGGVVRIESPHGYSDIGSRNEDWFHFETDRPNFWFNKGIQSNGDLKLYQKDTYMRHSDGAIFENNKRVATQAFVNNFFTGNKAKDSDKLDGKDSSAFLLKTGGTMTGDLIMTNRVVKWAENSDAASIGFHNEVNDVNSYMYFKTADNSDEHFRWIHKDYQESANQEWMRLTKDELTVNGNVRANRVIGLEEINAATNIRAGANFYENGAKLADKYLGKTAKAADSEKVDGINGASLLRSDTDDIFTGKLSVGSPSKRQAGIYGIYDSTKIGHIWSMGTAYKITQSGSSFGNLYGLAYKHTNNTTGGTMAGGHQAVWCQNGVPKVALGNNIWTSGIIYEGGTALSNKYLGKTAKATDSDKLDGIHSSGFVRNGVDAHRSWNNEYLIFTHNGADNVDAISYNDTDNAFHFNADRSKTNTSSNAKVYAGTLYEGTTALSNKYLGKTAKAADSNKLGGLTRTGFLEKTGGTINGNLTVNGSIYADEQGLKSGDGKGYRFWNSNSYKIYMSDVNDGTWGGRVNGETSSDYNMYFKMTGGSNRGFVFRSGSNNVAGIDASGNGRFEGSLYAYGNVTAYSDKRLKTALQPIKESLLDKIDKLKPTFYQWKDKAKDQAKQLGFIAQEVKDVFPEWVHDNGEHYSMSYDKMGAVLAVQGIQELRAEIKALKEELKSLKDGITK